MRWAGESSRKPRRPRPYSRHCDPHHAQRPPIAAAIRAPCRPASPHVPLVFTTTRHAASLSASTPFPLIIARRPQGLDGWRYAHNGSPAWGVNDGRCSNPPNDLPAMPTVGAGSSRSFAKIPPPIAIYVYYAIHGNPGFYHDAARRIATVLENLNCLI